MIELTQEQWQAIGQDENPVVIEPESKTAYVVVPKDQYDKLRAAGGGEENAAYVLRVVWMRRMGLDETEIAESLRMDPPVNIDQEMQELIALEKLKTMPSKASLRKLAIKY